MLEGNLKTKKKYKVRIDFPHRIFFIFRALSTVNDLNMNCDWKISQILWRKIMTFSQNSTSALCWDEVEWDKKKSLWSFRKATSHEMIYWNKTDFAQSRKKKKLSKAFPNAYRYFRTSNAHQKGTRSKSSE